MEKVLTSIKLRKQINKREKIVVTLSIGGLNEYPEFTITSDLYEYDQLSSCGCQHDLIAKHFPEIAHLIKWHLWSINGNMHYIANALYWLGWSGWWYNQTTLPDVSAFKRCINWGSLPDDTPIPDEWIATNHALLNEHSLGFKDSIDWYFRDNPHFAVYLKPYIKEYKNEISEVLLSRLPALRQTMINEISAIWQSYDGTNIVANALYTKLR